MKTQADKKRLHWFGDLFDFYFRTKVLGRKVPLLGCFKLTFNCNLKCRACPFHHRSKEDDAHISWDKAIQALQELKRRGCRIVVFEGGEPLLWKDGPHDIYELVSYAKRYFMRVAVTTNGTLPLDVPADVLWVSIDGLKQTHDSLRSDSFDRMWANLQASTHTKILAHFTMNKNNWHELDKLLERLREVPAFRGMTVQLFYPYGQGEEPLALSFAERKAALQKAIQLKRSGYPILNSIKMLAAMIENKWVCHDEILINVDPNGEITSGCYAKNRGEVSCRDCGFTPVAEASGALDLLPGCMLSGWRTFVAK